MPAPQSADVLAAGVVVFAPRPQGAAGAPPQVRRLVLPQGQARPRRARRPPRRCARWPRRPGCTCGSGPPLTTQRYRWPARGKPVDYWAGRAVGSDDVSGYRPNDEIDGVAWVAADEARRLLTYARDRDDPRRGADAGAARPARWSLLRHGKARSRRAWRRDDRRASAAPARPRSRRERLVPLLAAYDVTRVLSSSSSALRADGGAVRADHRLGARDPRAALRGGRLGQGRGAGWSRTCSAETAAAPCCAPTGRCCRALCDALGVPDPRLEPGRDAGGAPRARAASVAHRGALRRPCAARDRDGAAASRLPGRVHVIVALTPGV